MKKILLLAVPLACVLLLYACKPTVIRGKGPETTESRSLPEFSKISIEAPVDAAITVEPNAAASLEFSGYSNIISHLRTEVKDGTLRIFLPPQTSVGTDKEVKARIVLAALEGLDLSGESDAVVKGTVNGKHLDVDISGAGSVEMAEVQVEKLEADISGIGNLTITGGTVGQASYDVSGAGSVHCAALVAQQVDASVSGTGDVEANAAVSLDADVSGTGSVRYRGNPQVQSDVSGVGSVKPMP